MADLMASYKQSFQTFKKGDTVTGKITKLTKNEILVDINAKSEAMVLEKDRNMLNSLLSHFKVGDEVEVSILNPESESGNPVVSMRRFLGNITWDELATMQKEEKQLTVTVTDMTKGGAVVLTDTGMSGFLPNSHASGGEQIVAGATLKARILELNRKDNKIIFSQKSTISEDAFKKATKAIKVGDKVQVTVTNVTPFGIFVSVPVEGQTTETGEQLTLDGLAHISELSWEKVEDISQLYTAGNAVEAVIISFDSGARRVDLSIKQLTDDPFEKVAKEYPVEKKVTAPILKLDDTGAYLDLGEGVEALIKKEKIPPTVTYTEGQTVTATVAEIDRRRHRITLVPVLLDKPIGYR